MPSDPAQAEEHRDLRDGTAVIAPVTAAMLDHAAHEAAALADGVAHHSIALDRAAAPEAVAGAGPVAALADEAVTEVVGRPVEAVGEAAPDAVEAAVEIADGAAERTGEVGRDAPPAPTDAFGLYNAKVFEMMRANAASATALFAALVQARSVPEALSLNADHLRRQVETLTSQGRELATLAQRIALDALQPFKGPTEP